MVALAFAAGIVGEVVKMIIEYHYNLDVDRHIENIAKQYRVLKARRG
jgi:hypothetical protein